MSEETPYTLPKNYRSWLPGDGSLAALRLDHEFERQKMQYGLNSLVNPYTYAQVEFLLRVIDQMQE